MTTPSIVDKIEAVHERLQRARELFENGNVQPVIGMEAHFTVSSSEGKGTYLVNGECTCPDYEHRQYLNGRLCKHRLAVHLYLEAHPEPADADVEQDKRDLGW